MSFMPDEVACVPIKDASLSSVYDHLCTLNSPYVLDDDVASRIGYQVALYQEWEHYRYHPDISCAALRAVRGLTPSGSRLPFEDRRAARTSP